MSLPLNRLVHRFPSRKKDVHRLLETCHLCSFTGTQLQYLCDNVLTEENGHSVFEKFRQLEKDGTPLQLEEYLFSLVPKKFVPLPTQTGFGFFAFILRVLLRPLQRL